MTWCTTECTIFFDGPSVDKERARETFWQRWIASSGIGRRCLLAHHNNTSAHS
ncbi:MAG: hypothetical protein AVDCRST_MAG58-3581 [uncultured Rubrobacteraceae bacterium]|uniref:Uncharacterized protein n=1 Tax=uncultured Rubrobacteraceae bacterium TaxID=349277 RepID=A0A6J4RD09_9ACTN|nr:MAG: hypothetical protein AVDCRST_MAG58-3581 [uncultured Rubrobacteraceae bacterium]